MESGRVLICDFDGTITDVDTGELILTKLADGDWRYYHQEYVKGAISFEECLRRQFALVRPTTRASILSLIDESAKVRPGFEELLASAEPVGVQVVIASYGLDFCIEHVLARVRNGGGIRVYSTRTTSGADGFHLEFPKLVLKESANLKDDVVGQYKERGFRTIYVGDGASDLPAIERADEGFVIAGSELAKMCEAKGILRPSIVDFWPVAATLTG
jgi:2-hydroxy-3-keto-5-methylthiopentenyl-1-phosphate phosphatase